MSGEFSLSDAVPIWPMRLVDSVWKLRKVKRIMRELDAIVRNWIEEHVERRKERGVEDEQDFIDVMLSAIGEEGCYGYTRETIIKATILVSLQSIYFQSMNKYKIYCFLISMNKYFLN